MATTWRRHPLPPNWRTIRQRILARDGHQCTAQLPDGTRCPAPATDVDHIGNPTDHNDHNLRALCRWHHNKRTSQQANAARTRPTQRRQPEPHPGLH